MLSSWKDKEANLLRLNAELLARQGWAALRRYYGRNPPKYGNHYNPNQPRVPAGHPDGGQWTRVGNGFNSTEQSTPARDGFIRVAVRGRLVPFVGRYPPFTAQETGRYVRALGRLQEALASLRKVGDDWQPYAPSITSPDSNEGFVATAEAVADQAEDRVKSLAREQLRKNEWPPPSTGWSARPPSLGHNNGTLFPGGSFAPSAEPRNWLQIYRIVHNTRDIFGNPTWPFDKGTVAVSFVKGLRDPVFGTNSDAPPSAYTPQDFAEASRMRDILLTKHSDAIVRPRIGDISNQAPFHAEATVLMRIAMAFKRQGRTLEGGVFEVYVDNAVCGYTCEKLLPRIGLELGNPTVTFIDTRKGTRRTMRNGSWDDRQ